MKRYTLKITPHSWVGGCENVTITFEAECEHYRAFLALFLIHSAYKNERDLVSWLLDSVNKNLGGELFAPTLNAELTIE